MSIFQIYADLGIYHIISDLEELKSVIKNNNIDYCYTDKNLNSCYRIK